jgi:hypothetical protein
LTSVDALQTYTVGSMNAREARESGLWLKARLRHEQALLETVVAGDIG